jgi:hypothetical protein
MNKVTLGLMVSILGVTCSLLPFVIGWVSLTAGAEAVYRLFMVGDGITLNLPLSLILSVASIPVTLTGLKVFRRSIRRTSQASEESSTALRAASSIDLKNS